MKLLEGGKLAGKASYSEKGTEYVQGYNENERKLLTKWNFVTPRHIILYI